jgi:hypothetical protein
MCLHRWAVPALVFALVLADSQAQGGPVVLDQSTPTTGFNLEFGFAGTSNSAGFRGGQTFTVGVAGILDHVRLYVFGSVPAGTDLFEIRPTTAAGAPVEDDSQVLARLTVNIPQIPFSGFGTPKPSIDIDVSAFNIPVTVGEKLYFDLGAGTENLALAGFTPPAYSGGGYFYREPAVGLNHFQFQDFSTLGFQTYVQIADTVPEPSGPATAGFLAAGLALLAWWHRAQGYGTRASGR